jgi:hypothetical protein
MKGGFEDGLVTAGGVAAWGGGAAAGAGAEGAGDGVGGGNTIVFSCTIGGR